MTRRGSFAYYLAAVAVGCPLVTLAVWLPGGSAGMQWTADTRGAASFFLAVFLGLLLGATAALLFGFLLRRIVAVWKPGRLWHWIVAGALLAPAEVWLLARLLNPLDAVLSGRFGSMVIALLAGPALVHGSGRLWATVPVGALTAFVLHRIHSAFQPQPTEPGR